MANHLVQDDCGVWIKNAGAPVPGPQSQMSHEAAGLSGGRGHFFFKIHHKANILHLILKMILRDP